MLFAIFFAFWRVMQIITLIPTMGMLAWFVDGYNKNNLLSPDWLLLSFIVSVLALAWAMFTLFTYHRSSHNSKFVGLVDLLFVGALIAAVYYQRFVRYYDCTHVAQDGSWTGNFGFGSITVSNYNINTDKSCAMTKATWAFLIMNTFFFFFTAILAWMHGGEGSRSYKESHSGRHSHRRRSGSRHSRHSSHSHRRVYV